MAYTSHLRFFAKVSRIFRGKFGSDIIISRNKSKPLLVQYPHEKKQLLSELLF